MGRDKDSVRARYKAFRKKLLSLAPFIRRSRHERVVARVTRYLEIERKANETKGFLFFSPPSLANTARYLVRVPIRVERVDELCLFVTHAPSEGLKPHVIDHVEALLESGVAVLLIVNTDVVALSINIPPGWEERLYGAIVRENTGFDFAAWSHAYSLTDVSVVRHRLYLVNDSLVGPLDRGAYKTMLQQIRSAQADFVGLTCNPDSHEHLQSFYLVFNEPLLHSAVFDKFMRGIFNLPTKQAVVDSYEIWLTPFLVQQGFRGVAVFPNLSSESPPRRDETLYNWRQLLDAGFPFIKAKVLTESATAHEAREFLPARYLRSQGGNGS